VAADSVLDIVEFTFCKVLDIPKLLGMLNFLLADSSKLRKGHGKMLEFDQRKETTFFKIPQLFN